MKDESARTGTIAARLRKLIDLYHDGDRGAAAERMGLRPRTLARLLDGTTRLPSMGALAAIVQAYDCDATWLLTGEMNLARARLEGPELAGIAHVLFDLSRNLTYRRHQAERRLEPGIADGPESGGIHVA